MPTGRTPFVNPFKTHTEDEEIEGAIIPPAPTTSPSDGKTFVNPFKLTEEQKFEALTPEEQAKAGAGIGPNVPADVPNLKELEETKITSKEFAEQRRADRTFVEQLEREILPTAGSIIGPLLLATPQGRALGLAGKALQLGKTMAAAGTGGAVGEALQIANEYLRGDMDAPEDALDVASRLGEEAAYGAAGEALGLGAIRAGNLATRAWNKSIQGIEETGKKIPVVKQLFKTYDVKRYKHVKEIYEGLTTELAERAGNNLNPQQLGDLFADTIREGNAAVNTVFKETLRQLDSNPALRTSKVVGQEPTGLVDNLGRPIMKDVTTESPNAINLSPIKEFASNRLNRFVTGKTEEGFRATVKPDSQVIASQILEELNKASDNTGFTESFVLKNEILNQAITAANTTGNDSLANNLKAIQNRLGTVMEESAKRIGGETKEIYDSIVKNREKLSDEIRKTFLRDTLIKNPGLVGSEVLPKLSPSDTIKLKRQIQMRGEEGAEIWQKAIAGYSKAIADKIVDANTGKINREAFKNILDNPQQRKQIAAVFGKEHYAKLKNIQEILEKQISKPGDYLVHTGNIISLISGIVEPTTAAVISGGLAGARGASKTAGIAVDVLGRMLGDPSKAELLKKALSLKGDSPGAARIMSQLTMAIAETANSVSQSTNPSVPKPKKAQFVNPFAPSSDEQDTSPVDVPNRNNTTSLGKSKAPLGIRNNNPGNIRKTDISWQGKVQDHTGPFERFETPEAGIRALATNLKTYQQKYGLDTVEEIISRWAPPSENATGDYIKTVSRKMGVKPNEQLNLSNPATMQKLIESIIYVENGTQPYDSRTIKRSLSG